MNILYGILIGLGSAYVLQNIIVIIWAMRGEDNAVIVNTTYYTSLLFIIGIVFYFVCHIQKIMYKQLYKNNNILVYDWSTQLASQMSKEEFQNYDKEKQHNLKIINLSGYGKNVYPFRNTHKNHKYWERMAFRTNNFQYCPKRLLKHFDYYRGL